MDQVPSPAPDDAPAERMPDGKVGLAVGGILMMLSAFCSCLPGGWPLFGLSLLFSFAGLVSACGRLQRSIGIVLVTLSGALTVLDLMIAVGVPWKG
jgi:hypothetical protein